MPVFETNSPEYWVEVLDQKRASRQSELQQYSDYYNGNHPLLFATAKFREAFGRQFGPFADNWCKLVVDAVVERLIPQGFRLGKEAKADNAIWDMWQRNNLDADAQLAHSEAVTLGDSYVLVWPDENNKAEITIESAQQVVVAKTKGNRRKRAAALKVWVEEDEYARATLYLPDFLYKLKSKSKVQDGFSSLSPGYNNWEPREVPNETYPLKNPLGVVPVIPLINNPTLLGDCGQSEIAAIIPVQAAVNKLLTDMIVASEFGAYRQRYAIGVEPDTDPETKQRIDQFQAAIERLWTTPNENAKFGDFEATDLRNFVVAIEMLVQHIASQTRTPPHYLNASADRLSGESIKAAETGLVAKANQKMVWFGEAWEEAMTLGLQIEGSKAIQKKAHTMETIWADPESRTESEHIDAVIKQKSIGVPDEILWEKAGYSPSEIERMREMVKANPPAPVAPEIVPT